MTLEGAVSYLREYILMDFPDLVIDWRTISAGDSEAQQLLWTNEELTKYINEAQKEACRASYILTDIIDIPLVASTAEYALDPTLIKIRTVLLEEANREIYPIEIEDLILTGTNWLTEEGSVYGYVEDYKTGIFRPYRIPEEADTVKILAYVLPQKTLVWATDQGESLEIPDKYQVPMLYWAAYLAYNKQDSDILDENKAIKFRSLFQQEFESTSAYSEKRKERTRRRQGRYGGIPLAAGRGRLV